MFNFKEDPVICSEAVTKYFPRDFLEKTRYIIEKTDKDIISNYANCNIKCISATKFRDIGCKTHQICFVINNYDINKAVKLYFYYGDDYTVKIKLEESEFNIMKMTFVQLEEATNIFISILNMLLFNS